MNPPFIVTLTGPTCAGKSTLEAALKKAGFENVISTTTRAPRAGEVDGKSYYFVSKAEFQRQAAERRFVEAVEFNGQLYGVSITEVERVAAMNKPIVVIVEPEGLKQIKTFCNTRVWNYFTVFIDNPGKVIGERFITRFMDDLKKVVQNGVTEEAVQKVETTYANRLGVMIKDECWWGEDVGPICDLWLHEFHEGNIDGIVERIVRLADECLATN